MVDILQETHQHRTANPLRDCGWLRRGNQPIILKKFLAVRMNGCQRFITKPKFLVSVKHIKKMAYNNNNNNIETTLAMLLYKIRIHTIDTAFLMIHYSISKDFIF